MSNLFLTATILLSFVVLTAAMSMPMPLSVFPENVFAIWTTLASFKIPHTMSVAEAAALNFP